MLAQHLHRLQLEAHFDSCDLLPMTQTTLMPSMDALRLHASPTPMEIDEIERAVQEDEDTIAGYLDVIVAIQQTLLTLRTQLDTVYASAALKRAVIAPIRKLPPEIIGSILTYVLHEASVSGTTSDKLLHHPALRTCRLWRDLAFSTSIAWSFVNFYLNYSHKWCSVLDTYMRLAGTRPVHLRLSADGSSGGDLALRVSEKDITGVLPSSAARWRTLRLRNLRLPHWLSAETLPLTTLRSVSLNKVTIPTTDSAVPSAAARIAPFERCPTLTHVSLEDTDIVQLCLPLAQLLHLDVLLNRDSDDLVVPCLDALGACQALTSLELVMRAPDLAPHMEIQLPSLEYLLLSREASSMLKILTTPKLSRLCGTAKFDDVLQYAQRHETIRSTVTSLTLTAAKVDEADWVRLSKLYPKVTRLDILNRPTLNIDWFSPRSPSEYKEELQLMRALSRYPDLLPELTYLHLRRFEVRGPNYTQVIEDLVEARTGCLPFGAPGLKVIHFSQCEDQQDWDRLASALAGRIKWKTKFGSPHEPFVERDSISPRPSWYASDASDDQEQEDSEEGSTQDLDERPGGSVSTDSEASESEDDSEDAGVNLVTLENYVDDSDDDGRWAWEAHLVDESSVDEEWIHPGNMSYEADANARPPHDLDDERLPYNLRATKFPIHRLAPRRY